MPSASPAVLPPDAGTAEMCIRDRGGAVGWDVPVENISAIVAIEPGGTPEVGSEQYNRLLEADIPIVIYFGDYIDNGPEDLMSVDLLR